ncbi:MAG: hypothetical protein WBA44_12885 [Mesorhizobium sp.]
MIRFVVAAIWICGVTLGSIYYSFSSSNENPASPQKSAEFFGGLDYVKTDILSIPVVAEGAVQGYFIGRFVYAADQKRLAAMTVPTEALVVDEVFTYLYSNPMINFVDAKKIDINAFRTNLRDAVNRRVGEELLKDVMIEQVDFLSKDEIRANAMRRRNAVSPAAAAAAAGARRGSASQ